MWGALIFCVVLGVRSCVAVLCCLELRHALEDAVCSAGRKAPVLAALLQWSVSLLHSGYAFPRMLSMISPAWCTEAQKAPAIASH